LGISALEFYFLPNKLRETKAGNKLIQRRMMNYPLGTSSGPADWLHRSGQIRLSSFLLLTRLWLLLI